VQKAAAAYTDDLKSPIKKNHT
jgi:hypothetical protein